MKIAVIPARGGSKRIPRKNIRLFCGQPMLYWAIKTAKESKCFDKIIVSTDDHEVASIARKLGGDVPFMRDAGLSDDLVGTGPVVASVIRALSLQNIEPDFVCCIYATAPFLQADDLRRGLDLLESSKADFAFSVTDYSFPVQRSIRITDTGRVEMLHPEHLQTRSQDLEKIYHDAAQFYWGRSESWLAERPVFSKDAVPVILPNHRVQDIDTMEDWARAEWMFKAMALERKARNENTDELSSVRFI